MAKLVSLLSLLSAIIGLVSCETKQLGECGFSFLYDQPEMHELWRNVKHPSQKGAVQMKFGHYAYCKEHTHRQPPTIDLDCNEATKSKILNDCDLSDHVVELDLFLEYNDVIKAHVSCLTDPELNDLEYIVKQSVPVAYDVTQFGLDGNTAIIPSNIVDFGSPTIGGLFGHWLRKKDVVKIQLGFDSFTTTKLKFEPKAVERAHTTVAFLYENGSIRAFYHSITTVDTSTRKIICTNMVSFPPSFVLVLSEKAQLDQRLFVVKEVGSDRITFSSCDRSRLRRFFGALCGNRSTNE